MEIRENIRTFIKQCNFDIFNILDYVRYYLKKLKKEE